jgi:hypothetical protein
VLTTSSATTAIEERCEAPGWLRPSPYVPQINRLYRPISSSTNIIYLPSDDEDELISTQLLPMHDNPGVPPKFKSRVRAESLALADVWGEREDMFSVGEDEERVEEGSSHNAVRAAEAA